MLSTQGAGQRLREEFVAGQVAVDRANRCVKNSNSQEFFVTTSGRIMRYDEAVDQYNVYDRDRKDFVPCDGLEPNEAVVKHSSKLDLFNGLLAQPDWSDWFCTKGANFGAACGKQILFGVATATVGAAVGPVISRSVNRAMDAVGYTSQAAKPVMNEPVAHTVKTGVQAKAAGLNAIRGHVRSGFSENASGLRKANAQIIHDANTHFPRVPRCPVNGPFFPRGTIGPIGPRPLEPFAPFNPWGRTWLQHLAGGVAAGGTTATGAVMGAMVGGPVGGIIGGAFGAGVGSFFA